MNKEFTHIQFSICNKIFPIEEAVECNECGNMCCKECGSYFGQEENTFVCEDCQCE